MKTLKALTIVLVMTVMLTACSAAAAGDLMVPTGQEGAKGDGVTVVPEEGQAGEEMATDPNQTSNPNEAPANPEEGPVYLDSYKVLSGDTSSDLVIHLVGNLPTSCSQLVLKATVDPTSNSINVLAYSTEPKDTMCAQVLTPFDHEFKVPNLKNGNYDLIINGEVKESIPIPFEVTIQGQ